MATDTRDFFPFVEEDKEENSNTSADINPQNLEVHYPARIAVYDDPTVTPRVVVIEPTNVRDYLASITETVTKLSHEQGGSIPFTIIREIVENYIHASFIEPTITIWIMEQQYGSVIKVLVFITKHVHLNLELHRPQKK